MSFFVYQLTLKSENVAQTDCLDNPVQNILSKEATGVDSTSLINYYYLLFQR